MPFKGANKHRDRLKRLSSGDIVKLAGAIVYEGADTIRAHAHRKISAGSVSGKQHIASKSGDYPNRDTGILQANLEALQTGLLTAEVRSSAPYAAALEFSPSPKGRPYMRPSRAAKVEQIRDKFASQIGKLVKRSG